MFIVYNGFAQNREIEKRRNMITFPNGDESITIISHEDNNEIKLTTTDNFHKYRMLELSNHEAVHPSPTRNRFIKNESSGNYSASSSKIKGQKKKRDTITVADDTSGV